MRLKTFRQRVCGLLIDSPFPLPGAATIQTSPEPPDVAVEWYPETMWEAAVWRVTQGAPSAAYPEVLAGPDSSIALSWGNELKFVINGSRNRVCIISRAAKLQFAPTVFVGFVLGYLLSLRGRVCLHGAVIERNRRATILMGQSGAGKSTIAAALVQRDARLVADDLATISRTDDRLFVEPACAGLRVAPQTAQELFGLVSGLTSVPYINKLLWDFSGPMEESEDSFCSQPVPLKSICALEHSDGAGGADAGATAGASEGPALGSPLPIPAALRYLVSSLYPPGQFHLLTQECLRDLREIATTIPIRVLRYTKKWEQLPRVMELVGA